MYFNTLIVDKFYPCYMIYVILIGGVMFYF